MADNQVTWANAGGLLGGLVTLTGLVIAAYRGLKKEDRDAATVIRAEAVAQQADTTVQYTTILDRREAVITRLDADNDGLRDRLRESLVAVATLRAEKRTLLYLLSREKVAVPDWVSDDVAPAPPALPAKGQS